MLEIRTDKRSIEAREDPEGERLAAEAAARYLDARLVLARALRRVREAGTFHLRGCSSAVQYAVRLGVPTPDARVLVDLGGVLDLPVTGHVDADAECGEGDPPERADVPPETVEDRIRAGKVHVENAALVAKVLAEPGGARPGEDWVGWAGSMATSTLRRCVTARLEEVAQGTRALLRIDLHVTARAREGFERARVVASREAGTILTQGQTFALVVDRYLDAFDELRRGEGPRRVGPTAEIPGDRYVPAAVRREVLARSQDRCEVPACTFTTFLQFAHVRAHAAGGSREAENLLRLCTAHHTQLDAGCLVFRGWRDGRPVFGGRSGDHLAAKRSGEWTEAAPALPQELSGGTAKLPSFLHPADACSTPAPPDDRNSAGAEVGLEESFVSRVLRAQEQRDENQESVDGASAYEPEGVTEHPPPYGYASELGWSAVPEPG